MSGHSSNSSVPKFGSFKPKVVVEEKVDVLEGPSTKRRKNEDVDQRSKRSHERDERHQREKNEHHNRKKHHYRHAERSRSKERPGQMTSEHPSPNPVITFSNTHEPSSFVVDRRGDVKNVVYGSVHRYDVPPFRRFGAGNVLGCKSDIKIDRDASDDKGLVLSGRRGGLGGREKYVFARNEKKSVRLIKVRQAEITSEKHDASADFILLRKSRRKIRAHEHDEDNISSDDGRGHYRSIEGKAKARDYPSDEDLEYVTDASSDSENGRNIKFDAAVRQKSIELSRRVEKNPRDVEGWVALIDHQDVLLGLEDHRKTTFAERRSTADIKIHMYEKALQNIDSQNYHTSSTSDMEDRERLLVGLMAEGSKIWDTKTLAKKWEAISAQHLASSLLGKRYLDFQQGTFATFKYEKVRDVFISRIKLLNQKISVSAIDEEKSQPLLESLVYTLLRASLFVRESGYTELAIAIWQGLLELNINTPKGVYGQTSESVIDGPFREFWESETPRFGENESRGWCHFFASSNDVDIPEPRTDEEIIMEPGCGNSIFGTWVKAERSLEANSREPARTMDEVTENDPYRVILFNDIEPFLTFFPIPNPLVARFKVLLIDAFLLFCQLPPFSHTEPQRSWWQDPFIRGDLTPISADLRNPSSNMKAIENWDSSQNELNVVDLSAITKNIPNVASRAFATSPHTYFSGESWTRLFTPWREFEDENCLNINYSFVKLSMSSLAAQFTNLDYLEYYLSFMLTNEFQDIKKICKHLLKQHSLSLRLYNAYGMIENSRGNASIATNTFVAALGMKNSMPEEDQKDNILLWNSLVWSAIDQGDLQKSLTYLLKIQDGIIAGDESISAVSPVIVLKARNHLNSNREYLVSTGDLPRAILYAELCALLEYLASSSATARQGDAAAAISSFRASIADLRLRGLERGYSSELLHQGFVRLLYSHARLGPFRPAMLRDELIKAIELFPSNTIFLSLFAWNESRLRIDDRVRTILLSIAFTEKNDNFPARIFAIQHSIATENAYATRATFENAVESIVCIHNWQIWQLYAYWCLHTKEFRHKAKDVFFRGLRAAPWSKQLAMFAFTHLEDDMEYEELKDVYKVLGEKELRIHFDMDESLEDFEEDMREFERSQESQKQIGHVQKPKSEANLKTRKPKRQPLIQ